MRMNYRTVFMGTSDFSVSILDELARHYPVAGVITQADKPAGRGKRLTSPPVKRKAEELSLPIIQPEKLKSPEVMEQLQNWQPDFIVVAAYGKILRQNILDLPRFGCINVHASYLPRWRGASPIQAAILNGDDSTGVTIMVMAPGVDTGPILAREKVSIHPTDDSITLSDKLARVGGKLLISTLDGYLSGSLAPFPQEEDGATYAAMIQKEDGILDFSRPAVELERKVRAFIDWPGATMSFQGQPLNIRKTRVVTGKGLPGDRFVVDRFPCVNTIDGGLMLLEVKPAGRNWMSGADFLRGTRDW